MKSIIITGATSMIGAALARRAEAKGIRVLCIARKGSAGLRNIPKSDLIEIEYRDANEYRNPVSDQNSGYYDVFYHLAWDKTNSAFHDDTDAQAQNIHYTLDAVRLAKRFGCKKFVGAGSQAEYGPVLEPLKPETPANPQSGYGVAKYAAGKLSRLLAQELGMLFNWARIVGVFGPGGASQTLITYTINELRAGRGPEVTKCEQIWDYLYCDDAADALLAIGENGADGKTYPLGSGDKKRLSEYLEQIKNIIAPNIALQFGKREYCPHQPMYLCADISELRRDTGWKPKISFEDGIRKTIAAADENRYCQGE